MGSKGLVPFSAPLRGGEQRRAGPPRPGTRKALLSLGRGPPGSHRREARGLGFQQRGGQKPPGFTDPCCRPSGWRNRSVTAFRRIPAPPGLGARAGALSAEAGPCLQHALHPETAPLPSVTPASPRSLPGSSDLFSDPRLTVCRLICVWTTELDPAVAQPLTTLG